MIRFWRTIPLGLLAVATPVLAHPGHGAPPGFLAGLIHPLTGLDHLLVMTMVGLWGGLAFPTRWWVCPAAFLTFMLGGFAYGAAGGALPIAEMLILASLAVLGVALLFGVRPPLATSAGVVALFAIGHGFAHGSEMIVGGDAGGFAIGFMTSTLLLHAAGIALSRAAMPLRPRLIGQAVGGLATILAAVTMWSA